MTFYSFLCFSCTLQMLQICWNTLWGICHSHIAHKTPWPQLKNIQSKIHIVIIFHHIFLTLTPLWKHVDHRVQDADPEVHETLRFTDPRSVCSPPVSLNRGRHEPKKVKEQNNLKTSRWVTNVTTAHAHTEWCRYTYSVSVSCNRGAAS